MNKLFNFAQAKCKWHKFPSFNLGGGAKLYKNFAQKLLAVSLCMAMVLLGSPVTAFAEDDVPVAWSVYIKATNVPELKVGEALPSLDDVQLEVTVFAPGVSSPSMDLVELIWTGGGSRPAPDPVSEPSSYTLDAYFDPGDSFTFAPSTTFASNLGVVSACPSSEELLIRFAVGSPLPVVTVDVVEVPDLVVGQPFPELDLDKNFAVSVTPAAYYDVTSASVVFATWCTTSDWNPVADGAVVQPGVSYGIGTTVAGDGALCAGPSSTAGVVGSLPVGAVVADADYPVMLSVGLVVVAGASGSPVLPPDDPPVPVTGVTLSDTATSLTVGESFNLTALVSPEDATNNTVIWESSDPSVADVSSDGVVTAMGPGTATITVTTDDGGFTARCDVTVTQPVTGVSLSETTKTLTVGESFNLTALVSPEDATNKTLVWYTSHATIASVTPSADGLSARVTAVGAGDAGIVCSTADDTFMSTCVVTVTEAGGSEPDSPNPPPGPDSPDAPPVDRSSWGTPYVREADGVTQYVVEDPTSPDYGMTSVELDPELASANSAASRTYWLRESSGSTSAWYGLTAHISTCHPGYRFYVQWLSPGDPGYDALLAQLDDAAKQRIEDDNGWIFNMGIRDPDGNDLHYITAPNGFSYPPSVYVQIGDDWDVDDLNAYYITSGGDENVPVDYLMLDYPGGTDTFGRMTLSHFSPYFIFDELTDAEKAALTPKPNDNTNNQTTDKSNSSGTDLPGTGDLATQLLISALAIVLVSSLGVMLMLITGKKKFEE